MSEPVTPTLGEEAARLELRSAGYCVLCNRIVRREPDGTCAKGHPAEAISGHVLLIDDERPPALPAINWAAFLVPMVWGPAHGLWVGAIFLPIWLFADSIIGSSMGGGAGSPLGGVFVTGVTLAGQWWFARRANGLAWRRVADRIDPAAFVAKQRAWLAFMVPLAVLLYGWGVYYRIFLAG